MSNIGMSILLSSKVANSLQEDEALLVPKREIFEKGLPTRK